MNNILLQQKKMENSKNLNLYIIIFFKKEEN